MRLTSLFSGSSGNCLLVEEGYTKFLIDAGLSGIKIRNALCSIGVDPCEISAILVTHEHSDHIAGVGILSRKFNLPIYSNFETQNSMLPFLGTVKDENLRLFENYEPFEIGELRITAFESSHDAADPVGFRITDGNRTLVVATDIGTITPKIASNIFGAASVFIEANHDIKMLREGSYPYYLKQRILSERGHLSNEDCGLFCRELIENGTERVMLGHLSLENNTPNIAFDTVDGKISKHKIKRGLDYLLGVARRDCASEVLEVK